MKKILLISFLLLSCMGASAQLTISLCQRMAQENYPLIKQYSLIQSSTDYSIANARKAYLPHVALSGQATYQSDAMSFPGEVNSMFSQMGVDIHGINKDQYKVGVDVSQNIWDGGKSKSHRNLLEADAKVQTSSLDVEMYALRKNVNNLFFGILILEEQLVQNNALLLLLESNLSKINALVKNGVAMQSDADAVSVEIIETLQKNANISSTARAYRKMLTLFIDDKTDSSGNPVLDEGIGMRAKLVKPTIDGNPVLGAVARPELQLYESQHSSLEAQKKLSNTAVSPTFKAFASGYYGNPGLNPFKDMVTNEFTLNYIVGVKMQWNIGEYYTKKNKTRKIDIAQQLVDNRKELFLFNVSLRTTQELEEIDAMKKNMIADEEIIILRTSIRKAAEAKLKNGVVDVNDLLREITAENIARVAKTVHEIELLKNIYDLKNTLNN